MKAKEYEYQSPNTKAKSTPDGEFQGVCTPEDVKMKMHTLVQYMRKSKKLARSDSFPPEDHLFEVRIENPDMVPRFRYLF